MPAWSGSGEASLPRCRWPPRPCMYPSMVGESQPAPGGRFYEGTNPITRAPTYPSLLTPSPCGVRSQHVNLGDTHIQTTAAAVVPREYVYLHQKASQCTSETREFGLVLDLDTTGFFFFFKSSPFRVSGSFLPPGGAGDSGVGSELWNLGISHHSSSDPGRSDASVQTTRNQVTPADTFPLSGELAHSPRESGDPCLSHLPEYQITWCTC